MADTAAPVVGADRDRIMDLEDRAAADAVQPWDIWLARSTERFTSDWSAEFGSTDQQPTAEQVRRWLRDPTNPIARASLRMPAVGEGRASIVTKAERATLIAADGILPMAPKADRTAIKSRARRTAMADPRVAGALTRLDDAQLEAAQLIDTLQVDGIFDDTPDFDTILGAVRRVGLVARTRAASTARFVVNAAANQARISTANDIQAEVGAKLALVWSPETDACIHCLAYAGMSVPADGTGEFPAGRSFDPRGGLRSFGTLTAPPLHPHCRCDLEPWSMSWGTGLPDALKREAERSVVKGWALPSESDAARRRAAEALLTGGTEQLEAAAPKREAKRRLAKTATFRRPPPPAGQAPRKPPPEPPAGPSGPAPKPPKPPRPKPKPRKPPARRKPKPKPAVSSAGTRPAGPRPGDPDWRGVASLFDDTERITNADAERRLAAVLGDPDVDASIRPGRWSADGRQAIVQTLEDLTRRFPSVARRLTGGIEPVSAGRGSSRAEAWARPPNRWTRTNPDGSITAGAAGGSFAFGGGKRTLGQTRTGAAERWRPSVTPRRRRVGPVTLETPFSGSRTDERLQHFTVAHEFGHQVAFMADEQMDREAGHQDRRSFALKKAARQVVDEMVASGELETLFPQDEAARAANPGLAARDHGQHWASYAAREISEYAGSQVDEFAAEAFAVTYLEGENAPPLARRFVAVLSEAIDRADTEGNP